jgi:hypothetical protein
MVGVHVSRHTSLALRGPTRFRSASRILVRGTEVKRGKNKRAGCLLSRGVGSERPEISTIGDRVQMQHEVVTPEVRCARF